MELIDSNKGIYRVAYSPESVTEHSIDIKFGGETIPAAPFIVDVKPAGDATKVKIIGSFLNFFFDLFLQ